MVSPTTKNDIADTAKNTAQSIKKDVTDTVDEAQDDLRETAYKTGKQVRHLLDNASETISSASDTVVTQVKDKPVQAALIALAAGFALGLLNRK